MSGSASKQGRPSGEQSRDYRTRALEMLFEKAKKNPREPILEASEVATNLDVNIRTARRILGDLVELGSQIRRDPKGIRLGGIYYYHTMLNTNRELKNYIAEETLELMPRGATLSCSPGTTVALAVRRLVEERQYHVMVTNSIGVLDQIAGSEISNLVLTGGEYHHGIHGCVGTQAVETFRNARTSCALVGVSGINEKGELFVRHSVETSILDAIVRSVQNKIFVVADVHKLTQEDTWQFASIRDLLKDKRDLEVYLVTNSLERLISESKQQTDEQRKQETKQVDRASEVLQALRKIKGLKIVEADRK